MATYYLVPLNPLPNCKIKKNGSHINVKWIFDLFQFFWGDYFYLVDDLAVTTEELDDENLLSLSIELLLLDDDDE